MNQTVMTEVRLIIFIIHNKGRSSDGSLTPGSAERCSTGRPDTNGADRISVADVSYQEESGDWWQVQVSGGYPVDSSSSFVTNSIQKARLTGLGGSGEMLAAETISIDSLGNTTVSQSYVDRSRKLTRQTTLAPDSTNRLEEVTVNGLRVASLSKTNHRSTFLYDGLRRLVQTVDGRGNTNTTVYGPGSVVLATTNGAGNVVSYSYGAATGLKVAETNAAGETVCYAYDTQGTLVAQWGATYPVRYDFDDFGRMIAMYTLRDENVTINSWSDFINNAASFDKTTWLYDQASGLLTNKVYADGKGTKYTYTVDGKLTSRAWARNVTTTYSYSNSGELTGVDYSDSTPDVTYTIDRIGRQVSVTDGNGTRALTYGEKGQLLSEGLSDGVAVLARSYDSLGREAGFQLTTGGVTVATAGYGFDELGRFSTLASSNNLAGVAPVTTYGYVPGVDLVQSISNSVMQARKEYELRRTLLSAVTNRAAGSVLSSYAYVNDAAGRRTQRTDNGSQVNSFKYNSKSELTNAVMSGTTYGYLYDQIGNRTKATSNTVTSTYGANFLNQYTAVTNGPARPYLYDFDGNLTNDAVFAYTWDGENRLLSVAPIAPSLGSKKVESRYDDRSRRTRKVVSLFTNSQWVVQSTNTFLYDGWNLICERISDNSSQITVHNVWGLDLSGSLQGAGGIGGLVSVSRDATRYYATFDGNGNVSEYVDGGGNQIAHYTFDAYGNLASSTGTNPMMFAHRFSTKYRDDEAGLYYYGYRFYSPYVGRWLTRDPIEEGGGNNLYVFVRNVPTVLVDLRGLADANTYTYGEIGAWAVVSLQDLSSPAGLGDAKASIGACCGKGINKCGPADGSSASEPGDQAAWKNIKAASGSDRSGGGDYMWVGAYKDKKSPITHCFKHICAQKGKCGVQKVKRDKELTTVGSVTVGGDAAHTLYFYNDPLKWWCDKDSKKRGRKDCGDKKKEESE